MYNDQRFKNYSENTLEDNRINKLFIVLYIDSEIMKLVDYI